MRVLQEVGDEETFRRMLALEMDWQERNRLQIQISKELEYDPGLLDYIRLDAITGRHEQALLRLEDFVEKGFRGAEGPRHNWRFFAYYDITLDSIRDHQRFRAAIAVIEADMAQQLENVREMQRRGEVPTLDEVQAMVQSNEQESGSGGE